MELKRIKIIKYGAEQKYARLSDILRHIGPDVKESSLRTALYTFGLSRIPYGSIKHGIWYVSDPKSYSLIRQHYPRFPFIRPVEIHHNEIPHSLGMNDIRHAVENSSQFNVVEWLSEFYLRSLPPHARLELSYQAIPDAIFINREPNGSVKRYFVEFERSLKSRDRYRKIIRSYVQRPDVGGRAVLYVSQDHHILKEVQKAEQEVLGGGVINEAGKFFQFIHYDELVKEVANVI